MKNKKSMYLLLIIMLISMISIGYALLTGQVNINGNAKIKAASWDIYFSNIQINENSVIASVEPSISNKTTVNFEVELSSPGDYYEFNIDVVNKGTLDAMIESISITPELTQEQQRYLNYSVTYADNVPIELKDILHAKKIRTLKIRLEYDNNIENGDLNSNEEVLNAKVTINYIRADLSAKESTSYEGEIPKFKLSKITGDGTNVGDELAIGNEHFYVISNDGNEIVMLSKYNLLVGDICTGNSSSACTPIENPTGIQDESAKGWVSNSKPRVGTVPFSNTYYWSDAPNGTNIYNENSNIKQYINYYQNYLESFGTEIIEARLITKQELLSLGCPNTGSCTSSGTPAWVYATTYWSGSVGTNYKYIWIMFVYGSVDQHNYDYFSYSGVRPVIVVPADSI